MSCPSISCQCARCRQIRRHAYREGLADAHRVFSRQGPRSHLPVALAPAVIGQLLPALEILEWSGKRDLLGGVVSCGSCPECRAAEQHQEHAPGCGLNALLAQARIATHQADLFEVV